MMQARWVIRPCCTVLVLAVVLAWGLSVAPVPAQGPSPTGPAWQHAVEEIIQQYIRTHPEIIEESLQALDARRQAEEKERVRKVIAARQAELLQDPNSPVSGNLKGDVTVVEFFDYRCRFCKAVAGSVTQLQKDDSRVRVVYKDFPILGEASEIAAKAALASRAQGRHQSFHEALLAAKADLTREQVLHIASEVGLDSKRLETDMENLEWVPIIERNKALAKELGITGTPAFVVGSELYSGALDLSALKDLIAHSRMR